MWFYRSSASDCSAWAGWPSTSRNRSRAASPPQQPSTCSQVKSNTYSESRLESITDHSAWFMYGIKPLTHSSRWLSSVSNTLLSFQTYIDFFKNIATTNLAALILASVAMITMYLVKEYINPKVKAKIRMPLPVELFWVSPVVISYPDRSLMCSCNIPFRSLLAQASQLQSTWTSALTSMWSAWFLEGAT